jgi:hypothetical protein
LAVGEPVRLAAGFDDVSAEGEPVDDGGAEPWVGEGLAQPANDSFEAMAGRPVQ